MNIVPNSPSEHRGIDISVHRHCIVSEVVSNVELLVDQLSHIWIKAIDQRVTVVFPAIVLSTEQDRREASTSGQTEFCFTAGQHGEMPGSGSLLPSGTLAPQSVFSFYTAAPKRLFCD